MCKLPEKDKHHVNAHRTRKAQKEGLTQVQHSREEEEKYAQLFPTYKSAVKSTSASIDTELKSGATFKASSSSSSDLD